MEILTTHFLLSKSIEISLELEILILATIIIAINYRITSLIYCLQKYYVDTCIYIPYMSLYFRHKYRVLNNDKNIYQRNIYHTSTVIPEM